MSFPVPNPAVTDATLLPPIQTRWSTRAFDPEAEIDDNTMTTLLEAARWAPSAGNTQPWRFIAARRGTDAFERIATNLRGFNKEWAPKASAMFLTLAENATESGDPRPTSQYDLGQSVAFLVLQAVHLGLTVRQLAGMERDEIRTAFQIPERFDIISVVTVGYGADPAVVLSDELRERETLPRERKAVADILYDI